MRRILVSVAGIALVAPVVVALQLQAASAKQLTYTNRFAPSGTVSVDPARSPITVPSLVKGAAIQPATESGGCVDNSGPNVRMNQECTNQPAPDLLGRSTSQNETGAAVNPHDPNNVVAVQNDYRLGDSGCGVDWTYDGGKHWGSTILPAKFGRGLTAARHYWDAAGDPSVAFDAAGEAYYSCLVFDRGATSDTNSNASGFMLFRSHDGGASWDFPGNYIAVTDGTGNDGIGLLDKPYIAVDTNPGSPHRGRIYVAYIQYNVNFSNAEVWLARSDDHGVTWTNADVSGTSASLCPVNFDGSPAGTCNLNGFPEPVVAPNGDVFVVTANGNNCNGALGGLGFPCGGNPNDNHGQILIRKSTNGGGTFATPVKVSDYYDLPDCVTYTGEPFSFGTACVPTAPLSTRSVFRAANYPSAVALSSTEIVVNFGSYINRHSNPNLGNCSPAGLNPSDLLNLYDGVGDVDGCNNDIMRSVSTDGGATFTGTSTPVWRLPSCSEELGRHFTDQWWQWTAKSPIDQAVTSYYDRSYGNDQSAGKNDITLRRAGDGVSRVTDQSMPPSNEFPGVSGYSTFMGDYAGLAVGFDSMAHPVWADSRNPIFTFDESADARDLIFAGHGSDVYTARLSAE
jgi:hypothetical protein